MKWYNMQEKEGKKVTTDIKKYLTRPDTGKKDINIMWNEIYAFPIYFQTKSSHKKKLILVERRC